MFDYLDNAVIKLCDMSAVGTDLGTVKQQIEELKVGTSLIFITVEVMHVDILYFTWISKNKSYFSISN